MNKFCRVFYLDPDLSQVLLMLENENKLNVLIAKTLIGGQTYSAKLFESFDIEKARAAMNTYNVKKAKAFFECCKTLESQRQFLVDYSDEYENVSAVETEAQEVTAAEVDEGSKSEKSYVNVNDSKDFRTKEDLENELAQFHKRNKNDLKGDRFGYFVNDEGQYLLALETMESDEWKIIVGYDDIKHNL